MKNNRQKVVKPNLFWQWIKGIWSSFSRFVRRVLNPNQGRRPSSPSYDSPPAHHAHISPLVGISQFRNAESLKVGELMSKVQWLVPPAKAALSTSMGSVKNEINWD